MDTYLHARSASGPNCSPNPKNEAPREVESKRPSVTDALALGPA